MRRLAVSFEDPKVTRQLLDVTVQDPANMLPKWVKLAVPLGQADASRLVALNTVADTDVAWVAPLADIDPPAATSMALPTSTTRPVRTRGPQRDRIRGPLTKRSSAFRHDC
jgi:hypothetical protein